ncbi:MAG: histone deacetylase [Pseudomonadota bacterium]
MLLPIVHHPAYSVELPSNHRFPMPKFQALRVELERQGLIGANNEHRPELASRDWLELVHTADYVTAIIDQALPPAAERRLGLPQSPELATRARAATAGTVLAARLALVHGIACNTAGGSHHAFADAGTGFCVFNDVAVAAAVLLAEGRVRRVLVVDLDVHQGDGTALIFHGDPRVFTFSMHAQTNFPARKQTSDLDVALPRELADAGYLQRLAATLPDVLDRSRPDLVFYNAGVDPHRDDRLGHLALSDEGLEQRDRFVLQTVRAKGVPLVGVIGGGYDTDRDRLARRHAILHATAAGCLPWAVRHRRSPAPQGRSL